MIHESLFQFSDFFSLFHNVKYIFRCICRLQTDYETYRVLHLQFPYNKANKSKTDEYILSYEATYNVVYEFISWLILISLKLHEFYISHTYFHHFIIFSQLIFDVYIEPVFKWLRYWFLLFFSYLLSHSPYLW